MSNYTRTTRECPVSQIDPELLRAIRDYFQSHNWGEVETETQLCCETVSVKKAGGWLVELDSGADSKIWTAVLLTAKALVWARRGDKPPVHVSWADLAYIRVKTFASILTMGSGLEISGLMEDSRVYMRGQIGMGPEPATEKFYEAVQQAIQKINPKSTRKWPSWMGGQ